MGGSLYSKKSSRTREIQYRTMSREEIFTSREINDLLNPYNLTLRVAHDSETHPNTVPIIIAFDVTGSMGEIPYNLVKNHFSKMMETLINNGVEDATICFCAVGDHYTDSAPLQVGQFESGDIELNNSLTSIWLEGGGGGQMMESYLLAWLFAARHTQTDAFDKRNKKGFLFTIGDEWNHPKVESAALKRILGYKEVNSELMAEKLLEEVEKKWNVYHIHCSDGSYGEQVSNRWKKLLGENCMIINSSKIVDVICTNVAILNGADIDKVIKDLKHGDSPDFIKI